MEELRSFYCPAKALISAGHSHSLIVTPYKMLKLLAAHNRSPITAPVIICASGRDIAACITEEGLLSLFSTVRPQLLLQLRLFFTAKFLTVSEGLLAIVTSDGRLYLHDINNTSASPFSHPLLYLAANGSYSTLRASQVQITPAIIYLLDDQGALYTIARQARGVDNRLNAIVTPFIITQLSAMLGNVGLICSKGELYLFGKNAEGQLGQGPDKRQAITSANMVKIEGLSVISLSVGSKHISVVNQDGKLLVAGSILTEDGAYPIKDNFTVVHFDKRVREVSSGGGFTLFLDERGDVYGFGNNVGQQLRKGAGFIVKRALLLEKGV